MLILDIILTIFGYLLVPVIFCIRNKPMTKKQIKKVIIINAIVVWFVFQIIISASGGTPNANASVFIWSWVGKKIMERVLLKDEENRDTVVEEKHEETPNEEKTEAPQTITNYQNKNAFCRKCGNQLLEDSTFCNKCGTKVINEEQ